VQKRKEKKVHTGPEVDINRYTFQLVRNTQNLSFSHSPHECKCTEKMELAKEQRLLKITNLSDQISQHVKPHPREREDIRLARTPQPRVIHQRVGQRSKKENAEKMLVKPGAKERKA
jgi:hypothetical protein